MTTDHDPIEILYQPAPGARRIPAITIARLAALKGWTTKAAQMAVKRLVIDGTIHPLPLGLDGRTPLYPRRELLAAIDQRPGRGRLGSIRAYPPTRPPAERAHRIQPAGPDVLRRC